MNNPGEKRQIFELTFNSNYIMGHDPYNDDKSSIAVFTKSKPKKVYEIKKVKGFNRVVEKGWEYIVELLK